MSELDEFFDDYRAVFASYDREGLAGMFSFPVHVVSAGDGAAESAVSVFTAADWDRVLDELLASYRSLGVADADLVQFEVADVAARVSSARVHWELRRGDGSPVYDFNAVYTLTQGESGWRIAAIAHDELPKLQAALA